MASNQSNKSKRKTINKQTNNNKTNKQTGNFSFIIHFLFNTSIFTSYPNNWEICLMQQGWGDPPWPPQTLPLPTLHMYVPVDKVFNMWKFLGISNVKINKKLHSRMLFGFYPFPHFPESFPILLFAKWIFQILHNENEWLY